MKTNVRRRLTHDGRVVTENEQHDANEAFGTLLTACDAVDLHTFRNIDEHVRPDSSTAYTTPHWKLFGALVRETTKCSNCPHLIIKHDVCSSFSVAVPRAGHPTIETLFTDTLGHEPLDDAADRCAHCGRHRCRSKETVLVRKPQVLVVHLKRWTFDRALLRPDKIPTHVSFETLLPLDADNTYDLRSVIVHHGDAGGGHYTAFVRAQDNLWYHCNDEEAPKTCSTEQALRAQAYMLVYERR